MFNHTRGLWGYTGAAADGEPLTVQSTGMGGPSAAIVAEELIALGARRLVRIGTCGALDDELELGDLVAAETVLPADGASAALGADGALGSDPELLERLVGGRGASRRRVVSSDLFYDPRAAPPTSGASAAPRWSRWRRRRSSQVAARARRRGGCVLGGDRRAGAGGRSGRIRSSSSGSACAWARRATRRSSDRAHSAEPSACARLA